MYAVFEVESEKFDLIQDVLSDELVSKQTTSIRDGKSLGMKEDVNYFLVEGSEEAINRAEELFEYEDVPKAENAEDVKAAIEKEDEAAAQGMGTVFG
ncbi:MAG: hypothetical protein R6W73_04375 [Candidatus Saliniplasma sp.]